MCWHGRQHLLFSEQSSQFHGSVAQSRCCLANFSLLTLFCGLSSGLFAASLLWRPAVSAGQDVKVYACCHFICQLLN